MPRGRRKRDTAPSGVPVMIIDATGGGGASAAPAKQQRQRRAPMQRTRRGAAIKARVAGRQVTFYPKEWGVQIGASLAEMGMALASSTADLAVQFTDTTVDDTVVSVLKPVIGTGMRLLAGRVGRRHPALGYIMGSAGSALNGDYFGSMFRAKGLAALKSAGGKP